jgi:hypothetical protein
MKFADLLSFQKHSQGLDELHAKLTALAALNPRSRTEFLEGCEVEAKDLIAARSHDSDDYLTDTYNICVEQINALKSQSCTDIIGVQNSYENILNLKRADGLQRHAADKNNALHDFTNAITVPDVLSLLRSANQYDSLVDALLPRHQSSLSFRFRILSRKNESYGANNWATLLSNTAENFYDLLMGAADDEYHSDLELVQNCFLQGTNGNFVCNKMFSAPAGYNYATGTAPMAAVGAFSLENVTDQDVEKSLKFGLSSYNFAAVFLKLDEWTPLFQTASNLHHSSVMSADFIVPANQTATILLVSTPYYYRYSVTTGGRGDPVVTTYNSHLAQFLQWNIFGIREMLGDTVLGAELLWRF